jgi:hypothetical protein
MVRNRKKYPKSTKMCQEVPIRNKKNPKKRTKRNNKNVNVPKVQNKTSNIFLRICVPLSFCPFVLFYFCPFFCGLIGLIMSNCWSNWSNRWSNWSNRWCNRSNWWSNRSNRWSNWWSYRSNQWSVKCNLI